jgi:aminomethyltransferase
MTGYEALRTDAAWIQLARAEIRVTGEDRARLLHAMSTNNINELGANEGVYAFFLNAQGRILADADIWNLGDCFLLDTEPELREKLYEHLDKYIIADDVYLHDETEAWKVIGLEGPNSLEAAAKAGLPVPAENLGAMRFDGSIILRAATTQSHGLRILIPATTSISALDHLLESLPQATIHEARIVRLENGVPRYGEEISERYLVQETGLLQAVHPNKGCYLGQEIVERVRSRAQVHRHLRHVRIDGTNVPAVGTKLQSAEGKDVAEIVSAVYSPAWNAVAAFAYVRTEALSGTIPMVVSGSEPPATATLLQSPNSRP